MNTISGRWFYIVPISVFIIWWVVTTIQGYVNSLCPEEYIRFSNDIILILKVLFGIWCGFTLLGGFIYTVCEEDFNYFIKWNKYSPVVILILLGRVLGYVDRYFVKHFTVKLK